MNDFVEYVENELTYSRPQSGEQADVHAKVSALYLELGKKLAEIVPSSPDGTKMVNHLTISRAWAQKAVAQHWNPEFE